MNATAKSIGEMRIQDIVPETLLNQICALQDIYDQVDAYMEKKAELDGLWKCFEDKANEAREFIARAKDSLSDIAGYEISYILLNNDLQKRGK
ncbi:MAG: hypothetical protein LBH12_00655 [Dysgonamonadaceae bacterium]|jgi:hypothetical protein|nr:hypothetical protein [Dysgonamonadaceae bacterium]